MHTVVPEMCTCIPEMDTLIPEMPTLIREMDALIPEMHALIPAMCASRAMQRCNVCATVFTMAMRATLMPVSAAFCVRRSVHACMRATACEPLVQPWGRVAWG
jgi:hypothetical protein